VLERHSPGIGQVARADQEVPAPRPLYDATVLEPDQAAIPELDEVADQSLEVPLHRILRLEGIAMLSEAQQLNVGAR
jgi:hypothetical protein